MSGPVMPISAAAGDPKKTLIAPADCTVKKLLDITTAMTVEPGQPLLQVDTAEGERQLTAPMGGLIVYIPAKEGQKYKQGEALVLLL